MPAEGSPFSATTRVLAVDVTPQRADDVAGALRELIGRLPQHPGLVPILDAGVADGRAFIVTPHIAGESLDAALSMYGPAALADALPRLQQLADALDCIADRALCHGSLTPADIVVSSDDTRLIGAGVAGALAQAGVPLPLTAPYAAPEILAGQPASARADQYALAVITFEWLFGRRFDRAVSLRGLSLPGLNTQMLARCLATALADAPADRFDECAQFVAAIADSATAVEAAPGKVREFAAPVTELPLNAPPAAEVAWPVVRLTRTEPHGYGGVTLAAALVAGLAVGGVAVWMYLAKSPPAMITADPGAAAGTSASAGAATNSAGPARGPALPDPRTTAREVTEAEINPPRDDVAVVQPSRARAADATAAAQVDAGLLVHSAPAGALVSIDGAPRGRTPIAVRGLDLGTHAVVVSRPGYHAVERRIVLTDDRPSRTVEVDLAPVRTDTAASPVVREGSIVVDSRPAGATVIIDGRRSGVTPLTVTLAPGPHVVRLEYGGYRTVSTRVEVKAGERTRVAARLEGGRDEE